MGTALKNLLRKSLESRKAWAFLIGILAGLLTTKLGLSEELTRTLLEYMGIVVGSFLVGQGIADAGLKEAVAERIRKAVEAPKPAEP